MIIPAIRFTDPDTAVNWLSEAFGLTQQDIHRDEDGHVVHAVLRHASGTVMISGPRAPGWLGGGTADPLASTVSLYLVVEDPPAHFERAKAAGATIVRELEHMDYGSHEYSARDLEGNLWSFGTYQP